MRYMLVACFSVALSMPIMIQAADAPKLSPAEQEVVEISKARMEAAARRNMAAWTSYVTDDCLFSSDDGVLITKTQMLEHYRKLPAEDDRAVDPRDHIVHIYGNTAVVNYRATVHEQFGDADIISEQRRTETFFKQNGSWLLIAIQWDNLPVNFRQPVAIDGKFYQDYVGHYQWRLGDDVETVFLKDGRLWSQIGDEAAEYLPAGGETFFVRDDLGSMSFVRDAQGGVIGYTYHRVDGQEIRAKKIK